MFHDRSCNTYCRHWRGKACHWRWSDELNQRSWCSIHRRIWRSVFHDRNQYGWSHVLHHRNTCGKPCRSWRNVFLDRNRCRRWHCEACRWCWSDVLLHRNRCDIHCRSWRNILHRRWLHRIWYGIHCKIWRNAIHNRSWCGERCRRWRGVACNWRWGATPGRLMRRAHRSSSCHLALWREKMQPVRPRQSVPWTAHSPNFPSSSRVPEPDPRASSRHPVDCSETCRNYTWSHPKGRERHKDKVLTLKVTLLYNDLEPIGLSITKESLPPFPNGSNHALSRPFLPTKPGVA